MKSADVEVIASSKITADSLGTFFNSMHLTNYEWSLKSDKPDEDKEDKKDEEDLDERTKRTSKKIDTIEISHEQELSTLDSFLHQKVSAEATCFARDMANTRGSVATPQWMEERVTELLEKSDATKTHVKEVRILRASQL